MRELIFLQPVFHEMIWGGSRMADAFGYEIPGDKTGECWAVSAHKNGDCAVRAGRFKGMKLSGLWKSHRELFGDIDGDCFPLLVKIIDAKEDLSIQVHPDDAYASRHENGALGKTECWYILDCDEGAEIVIGHNAADKQELRSMIFEQRWPELIRVQKIRKGDFFQIDPGTVHAIKGGTLILETQQNSDITYRLYDYGRLQDGKLRELHLDKSIEVIHCPYVEPEQALCNEDDTVKVLVNGDYYKVYRLVIDQVKKFQLDSPFLIMSVIEGFGEIDEIPIKKGDHFIIPAEYGDFTMHGAMTVIASAPAKGRQ